MMGTIDTKEANIDAKKQPAKEWTLRKRAAEALKDSSTSAWIIFRRNERRFAK